MPQALSPVRKTAMKDEDNAEETFGFPAGAPKMLRHTQPGHLGYEEVCTDEIPEDPV